MQESLVAYVGSLYFLERGPLVQMQLVAGVGSLSFLEGKASGSMRLVADVVFTFVSRAKGLWCYATGC